MKPSEVNFYQKWYTKNLAYLAWHLLLKGVKDTV